MAGYVDIHTHLLPGVDDGCDDPAESLELARRMVDAGIGDVFCTPHIQPALPHNEPRRIRRKVERLREALDAADVPLRVHPGGENRVGPEHLDQPLDDLVLAADGRSRGGELGKRFFLFDDWGRHAPPELDQMIERLVGHGITPILAHPERTPWFWIDPVATARRLASVSVRLQLNAYVLAGESRGGIHVSSEMVRTAAALLDDDRYDFLATDGHHLETWPPRAAALRTARARLGESHFNRLFRDNPRQLLPA